MNFATGFLFYCFVVWSVIFAFYHQYLAADKKVSYNAKICTHILALFFASFSPIVLYWELSEKTILFSLVILSFFALESLHKLIRKRGLWFYHNPKFSPIAVKY